MELFCGFCEKKIKKFDIEIKNKSNKKYQDEWIKLYNEGLTYQQIANQYNTSKSSVCKWLKSHVLPHKTVCNRQKWSTKSRKYPEEEIIALYLSGKSCYELGKSYNCNHKTISYILTRNNVKVRNKNFYIGKQNALWNGYGDISSSIWSDIKRAANIRNLCFEITIEEAWEIFLLQNKCCCLTGLQLKFAISRANLKNGLEETTASLDRIDSSQGYTKDNVQWIHKTINKMKNDLSQSDFIKFCKLVANNA